MKQVKKINFPRFFTEKLKNLLSWLGFTEEGIDPEKELESRKKRLLSRYSHHELRERGERCIEALEKEKDSFIKNIGQGGSGFIVRHIDPVIGLLKRFIPSPAEGEGELSRSVKGSVELAALMRDERRPWKKIVESVDRQTQQALLEDVAFLMAYPTELLEQMGIIGMERSSTLHVIADDLQPIMVKFEKLLAKHPGSEDFSQLFFWREAIDGERQQLHDMALKCIDKHVAHFKLKFSIENGSVFWLGQALESVSRIELQKVFQYIFDLITSSESLRYDERVLEFFEQSKQHLSVYLQEEKAFSEEEHIRLLHTLRLIEELIGTEREVL